MPEFGDYEPDDAFDTAELDSEAVERIKVWFHERHQHLGFAQRTVERITEGSERRFIQERLEREGSA